MGGDSEWRKPARWQGGRSPSQSSAQNGSIIILSWPASQARLIPLLPYLGSTISWAWCGSLRYGLVWIAMVFGTVQCGMVGRSRVDPSPQHRSQNCKSCTVPNSLWLSMFQTAL